MFTFGKGGMTMLSWPQLCRLSNGLVKCGDIRPFKL